MKEITITLDDESAEVIERYRKEFGDQPDLDAVVQDTIRQYVRSIKQSLHLREIVTPGEGLIYPSGSKPKPMENPPSLSDDRLISDLIIEDRG